MSSLSQNRVGPDGVASTPTTYEVVGITLEANNVKNTSNTPYIYNITNMAGPLSWGLALKTVSLSRVVRRT